MPKWLNCARASSFVHGWLSTDLLPKPTTFESDIIPQMLHRHLRRQSLPGAIPYGALRTKSCASSHATSIFRPSKREQTCTKHVEMQN